MRASYRPPSELYPFAPHWLDLGGCRLHYLDEGPRRAPPVLMLHGNPGWSFEYRALVTALSGRFRCIVPDHVGCGLSDKPGDEAYAYRLEQRLADLRALLEHLALDQPLSLVMHDWGGMIGCAWAVRAAERVRALVVLNTAAFRMPQGKRLPFALWLAGHTHLGALLVRGCNAFALGAARVGFRKPVASDVRRAYTGPYDSWANRIATLRFVQDIPLDERNPGYGLLVDTESRLPALAGKPAMIAWGMEDFVFDRRFLERWVELLPRAEVQRLEGCGHYVLEDGGAPLVADIAAFLDRHGC